MDKYEYKLRAEEIKDLIAKRRFPEALKIAETIDWTRVRSVMMLCTVSDLYKINRRYEESKELLLLAYERHPGSRMIVYSLCELSIKMGEVVQAIEYYKEFVQAAPSDNARYILQYKLYEAQDVSLEERIAVLEEFEKREYKEKWMYELAYLYHRVGLATKCVEECDQLILWFGEGRYVDKAMELKMLHAPLSAEQQAKYDETHDPLGVREGRKGGEESGGEASQDTLEHAALPHGMRDLSAAGAAGGRDEAGTLHMDTGEMVTDYSPEADAGEEEEPLQAEESTAEKLRAEREAILRGDTMAQLADEEVEQIRIKPVDVSQYNTINLQKELAKSMNELFSAEETEQLEEAAKEQKQEAVPEKTSQMQEIFFEEEKDAIEKKPAGNTASARKEQEAAGQPAERPAGASPETAAAGGQLTLSDLQGISGTGFPEVSAADTPGKNGLQMPAAQDLAQVEVPEKIAPYLSQEYDGQISLVVPESAAVEKQITGQLNIQDVLAEWERLKKENEKKRMEEVRQRVLEQTGAMFTQFEAAARDGILEQLEKEAREEQRKGKKAVRRKHPEREEAAAQRRRAPEEEQKRETPGGQPAAQADDRERLPDAAADGEEAGKGSVIRAAEEAAEGVNDGRKEEFVTGEGGGVTDAEAADDSDGAESFEAGEDENAGEDEDNEDNDTGEDIEEAGDQEENEGRENEKRSPRSVKRLRPQGKELSREEKALFGSFLTTREAKEQMTAFLDAISLDAAAGNVLLTGDVGDGGTNLAKALVKYVKAADRNFSGKVAKTTGEAMNLRDLKKVLSRLPEGALVIEGAGKMNADTMERLIEELQESDNGILLILEDTRRSMNKLTESCPGMEEVFDARFDITQMNNSSLVMYGRKYAESREFSIDEMGVLELYTRIEDMQTADHSVTPAEVREIVDEAIGRAKKKTVGHFFDILVGKRYDEEDMIVLHEKDFM